MKFVQPTLLALLATASGVNAWGKSSSSSWSRWSSDSSSEDSRNRDDSSSNDSRSSSTSTSSSACSFDTDSCVESTSADLLLECSGHVGTVYGDPHITTFDGYASSCQAQGEFVLAEGDDITIQARFEALTSKEVSVTTGIAIAQPGIDTIQVSFAEYDSGDDSTIDISSSCPMHLYIDGVLQDANVGDEISDSGYTVTITSYSVDIQFYDNSGTATNAVQVQPKAGRGGSTCMFTTYFCLDSAVTDVVGLLGTPNGDCTDDFTTSTGTEVTEPDTCEEKFEYCTSYHCVSSEGDSIFVHEDDNGGMSFDELEDCSSDFPGEVDTGDASDELIEICGEGNTECLLDGTVFDEDAARDAVEVQDTTVAIHVSEDVVDTTPSVSTCPEDIVLLHVDGSADYDQIPLVIVNQTETEAYLKVRAASFTEIDVQYVEYEEDYVVKCTSSEDVTTSYSEIIRVTCPGTEHFTLVSIVASDTALDAESDNASPAVCCHADGDTNPKVKYTFMVSCESQCPEDSR